MNDFVKEFTISVSSLYGRVYRKTYEEFVEKFSFLPVREGVSLSPLILSITDSFPPCTGGCIGFIKVIVLSTLVSSLYGRVYRTLAVEPTKSRRFLPVREGVS